MVFFIPDNGHYQGYGGTHCEFVQNCCVFGGGIMEDLTSLKLALRSLLKDSNAKRVTSTIFQERSLVNSSYVCMDRFDKYCNKQDIVIYLINIATTPRNCNINEIKNGNLRSC